MSMAVIHRFFIVTTKQQKKEIIQELAEKFARQKAVVFSDYTGLTVNDAQKLREKLRENKIDYRVAKKTLVDLALKQAGFQDIKVRDLSGQLSVTLGYEDEVSPARILYNFSRSNKKLRMLAGLAAGDYLDSEAVMKLALLPSKIELLGKVVGGIAAPMSGMLNVLQGNMRKLVYILSNIKSKA